MLNRTHAEHAVIGVVVQVAIAAAIALATWSARPKWFVLSGAISSSVFFGREIAQHEYKGGGPNSVGPLYGLTHHWSQDGILDALSPIASCLAVAGVAWWLL